MPVMLSPGTIATELERPSLSRRAAAFGVYRSRRAASRTRWRVTVLIRARPLRAWEAVGSETPARRATSRRLLAEPDRPRTRGRRAGEALLLRVATRATATPAPLHEDAARPHCADPGPVCQTDLTGVCRNRPESSAHIVRTIRHSPPAVRQRLALPSRRPRSSRCRVRRWRCGPLPARPLGSGQVVE